MACLFQEHDGNKDAKSDTTDSINVKRDAIYPQNITTQEVEEHKGMDSSIFLAVNQITFCYYFLISEQFDYQVLIFCYLWLFRN